MLGGVGRGTGAVERVLLFWGANRLIDRARRRVAGGRSEGLMLLPKAGVGFLEIERAVLSIDQRQNKIVVNNKIKLIHMACRMLEQPKKKEHGESGGLTQ